MSCGDNSGIFQKEGELVRVTVFISPFSLEIVVFSFPLVYTVDFWCVYACMSQCTETTLAGLHSLRLASVSYRLSSAPQVLPMEPSLQPRKALSLFLKDT